MTRARIAATVCSVLAAFGAAASAQAQQAWDSSGGGVTNTSFISSLPGPYQITPSSVGHLKMQWFHPTASGISSTPTVEPGGVYVVVQQGALLKLDPATGRLIWAISLPSTVGVKGATTTSPAIAADRVVVGMGGYVLAINKANGAVIWKTLVDAHPLAKVHSSPVILNGHVYTGVASVEEGQVVSQPGYVPSFRGSAVALNLATGALEWKTYTVPHGYTGGAIWASSPVADGSRNLVYFANGDNYTVPVSVGRCVRAAGRSIAAQRACLDPTDYVDSILALDMATGAIKWVRPTIGADAWLPLASCADPTVFVCPTQGKPYDADFAQGPSLFHVQNFIGKADDRGGSAVGWMLGAGQKTGVYWALNPANGGLFWSKQMASTAGELKWGSAVDIESSMIFTALDNSSPTLGNDLVGRGGVAVPNSKGGVWSGVDAASGRIVFQIPGYGHAMDMPKLPGNTPGGLSVTNGVVFAGATSGDMAAFDTTGAIRWTFHAGGVIAGSPAILNDTVFWGSGNYKPAVSGQTTGLYAFSLR